MLDISGAGTQHPMRSHWKLRPGPQSHKNSKQQCKRYRANTVTANSKASATRQAAQQPQPAPLSHRRRTHYNCSPSRKTYTRGIDGEGQSTLWSCAPPVRTPRIRSSLVLWTVSGFASLRGVKEIVTSFAPGPA